MRPRLLVLALSSVVPAGLSGCAASQPKLTTDQPKPLKAEFFPQQARIVDGRYLLVPINVPGPKQNWYSSYGPHAFKASAWSALSVGGDSSASWLNLEIVDLQANTHRPVFERQVALGDWGLSFSGGRDGALRFANLLLMPARTADTNGDNVIDDDDEVHVFSYHLQQGELRQISPPGASVTRMIAEPASIVLILTPADQADAIAVYVYDPATQQGRFAAERITP